LKDRFGSYEIAFLYSEFWGVWVSIHLGGALPEMIAGVFFASHFWVILTGQYYLKWSFTRLFIALEKLIAQVLNAARFLTPRRVQDKAAAERFW
jgi:hypothetical protein